MGKLLAKWHAFLAKFNDLPPLFFRLVLAYGFAEPAWKKLQNFPATVKWFTSMNLPYPEIQAYLATGTEALAVILLPLGFFTRLISFPLMIVMLVAIFTVHIDNGFLARRNGFEIPFYYFLMLFSLFIAGPGKYSMDNCKSGNCKK